MTWSPPPVLRCRLVRGFEGFGQVLLLVGEQMAGVLDPFRLEAGTDSTSVAPKEEVNRIHVCAGRSHGVNRR